MSKADNIYVSILKKILDEGFSDENGEVRPKWEDGTPAHTKKIFGVSNTYDLRDEFPAITLRKTALRSCMDEILWIYQKKSNNIKDLNSKIWDQWADKDGTIGKAYGYQVGNKKYKVGSEYLDQMDYVLYLLKHDPFSRRIMIDLWNVDDTPEMALTPCCYNVIFNVTDEGGDKLVLNMVLNQRSNDFIVANNWNTAQYAILLIMVAQVSDMIPGRLMHNIFDCHIYDRHVDIARELMERKQMPAPNVVLNPDIKNFYDFTIDDLIVEDYVAGEQIKNIPVAI